MGAVANLASSTIGTTSMAERRIVQLNVFGGESEHVNATPGRITSRSMGWYPDNRGYLKTYMGGKKVLPPGNATPGEDGNDGPIAWEDKKVTNGITFTDTLGRRRTVVAVEDTIFSVDGVAATKLFAYPDDVDVDGGVHQIFFIEHQSNVLIFNPGFPPMKWGGDEPMSWLGVRDIPVQPEFHTSETWLKYFESYDTWGMDTASYYPPVFLQDDSTDPEVTRAWKWKCAFVNSRGQVGRWGPATYAELTGTANAYQQRVHSIVEWRRPTDQGPTLDGTDITHVVLARTTDLIPDPDAASYLVQGIYPYTQNRVQDQVGDAGLGLAIEEDNYPPVSAAFACIYKGRVVISGNREDPNGVWWSKPGFMESYPQLNYYRATNPVTSVLALSDRVVVVTTDSIEVLRLEDSGLFGLFRVESGKGSNFGQTLVVHKGAVFGVFNSGFGIFDGFAYKGMTDEYGELFDLMSRPGGDRVKAFVGPDNKYWACVPYFDAPYLGYVLCYDFSLNGWFRIRDTNVYCMWEEQDEIYSGGTSNFHLFDYGTGSADKHVLEFASTGLERQNPQFGLLHKEVMSLYFRMLSNGDYQHIIRVYSDERLITEVSGGTLDSRLSKPLMSDVNKDSVWDESELDNDAQWDAPRHGWQKVELDSPVEFYSLRVQVEVAEQAYAEISGVAMDVAIEEIQGVR